MTSCDIHWLFICPMGEMESGLAISNLSVLLCFLLFPSGLLQIFDCSFRLYARLSVYMVPGIPGCRLPGSFPDFGLAGCLNMVLKPFADPFLCQHWQT